MNLLVKPISESDGNLVILADNTREIHLVDLTTGELLESGRNTGPSNGREGTFRFRSPGGSYRNVGVMDSRGNVLVTLKTAGDRVQFNYTDYDALVRTPVSTIEGYRFNNSRNQEAQQRGEPSNADIASMTEQEYIDYLNRQQQEGGSSGGGGSSSSSGGGAGSVLQTVAPIVAEPLAEAALGVDIGQEVGVLTGATEGPLTETQSTVMNALSPEQATYQATADALEAGATAEAAQQAGAEAGQAAAAEAGITVADIATYAAWAYQAYKAYTILSSDMSDEDKAHELVKTGALAVADYFTFGGASLAYGTVGQTKEWKKVEREMADYDHVGLNARAAGRVWSGDADWADYLPGVGVAQGVGNLVGVRIGHKSTDEYRQERYSSAMRHAATDEDRAMIYAENELGKKAEGIPDDYALNGNPLAGRGGRWEDVKNVMFDGSQVADAQGFKDVFRDWYSGYTTEQRNTIAEAAIDHGYLVSDKGSTVFQSGTQADMQRIAAEVKAGTYQPLKTREQRYEEVQAYLRQLKETEGYESAWLDRPFEDVEYQLRLQEAVQEVDKARVVGTTPPAAASELLTIEHNRRAAAEAAGTPFDGNVTAPTAEEIERFRGPPVARANAPQAQPGQEPPVAPSSPPVPPETFEPGTQPTPQNPPQMTRPAEIPQSQAPQTNSPAAVDPRDAFEPGQELQPSLTGPSEWSDFSTEGVPPRNYPEYEPGAKPGTYRAPDGLNLITINPDGSHYMTLIGTNTPRAPGTPPPQQPPVNPDGSRPAILRSTQPQAPQPQPQAPPSTAQPGVSPSHSAMGNRSWADRVPRSASEIPAGEAMGLGMQPSDAEPPITDFEQIDGSMLPPPGGADAGIAAWNYLQSARSDPYANQMMNEALGLGQAPQNRQSDIGWQYLGEVFK